MKTLKKYASLVRFAHTVFAMPFALTGYVYGSVDAGFSWVTLVKVLLCMVFARNAAMGFNRWADRRFDGENPRTAEREIPSGQISARAALAFVATNVVLFVVAAGFINRLTLVLAPVALAVILGYSYAKRFTEWSHLVLGVALGIAPAGAYIAVTGTLTWAVVVLSGSVALWTAGFDILYSMQDAEHDRRHGLHSVPARFSSRMARAISVVFHALSLAGIAIFGTMTGCETWYWTGAGLFAVPLVAEHLLPPARLFTTLNGISSLLFAAFAILDLLL